MSTVDKMLIKGIRSFDPENKNVVTFFRPLTLIVGANGAGKTTIIECLKVSCTGELPPNARSGHSFIHDPKVAGETETKAQIKLRFKTAAGKDVVCIRSFQLTQKASKMEYKAIESVLQTINPHTGEKVCLSYRCADMDREIPALMGVSKAILENVIFVHQDESNWPLQDPSTLKKKFDDIFSATRYTKALEVIKKLHKDQAQEIKTFKLKLENLQTLKDAAYKLRESIAQDQERTESSKVQMLELETSIQKVDAEVHNKEMMLKDLRKLQDQVSRKTAERSTLFKEQQRQYAELPEENEDTIEELKEWKSKFEERIALLETKIRKMEREMDDTATTIYSLHNAKTNYMLEISKLQTEAEAHMLLKNERDSTIQKIFSHHNLGNVPSTPFGTEVVLNLTNRIKSRLGELEMDLLDKKKSNETALSTAWDCYMDANDRWKSIEAQKRAKDEIKMGISKRIEEKEIERDSFEFEISTVDVKQTDEREKQVQIELERKTKQNSELGFESKIEQKQHEIYSMEHKIKTLNRERDVMAGDAEDRVKLSLKKTEQENLRKKHKKMSIEREYDDLSLKSREAEKEVNMLQMKIQEVNNSLFKHNKDTESRKKYIESKLQALKQESVTIDAYPKLLESAKDERDDRKSKYNMANGMRKMFEPFEDLARQHHYCPCCERSFTTDEENSFVKKQRVKASTTGEQLKKLAVESSNADSVFQQLDKLRAVFEEYSKLTSEIIPLAEKSLQEHTEELGQKSQALDDVLGISAQIKADKDSIEALVHPLENADRTFQEIVSYQKQIEDLEYKLDFRGLGVKTMEEIQSELSSLQSSKDKLHGELEKLRDDQIYMERDISCLQARWHAVREEKAKAANLLRDVTKAEEDLERLAEEKSQLDLDVKYLAEALGPLSKEKEQLLSDYNDMKIRRNQEYEELAEKKRNYQQEVEALLKASSKINEYAYSCFTRYHDLKKGERLNDIQEKQRLSESQLQSCEARKNELAGELNRNKDLMRNQDQLRRNIEDNLNYRTTKAKVEELTPIHLFSMMLRLNRCRGTVSVYESSISKNRVELKAAQYKDIDKRHFDQLIQLKTTEMANKDLDRYYNALDKALMRFHTMKMEEINKIIRELWQQTYRGQDMDYIRIHSDSEGAGTRSYSYKVLASLIIRLALAETFCLNCGILALDEPTTNLDGPNSESLAGALLRIMEDRKGQENFQLIVITHDERFAQMIGQRQHAEKYYRVAKDDM
ncbi:hypothetical protein ARALYDRAFT_344958 [Arabidopsis lyrata subsp. lyrata]|uniref:DNA repair protein RAD50 n=1 Tax=Arabidopsis lyrata subsp. lyrata TaxID=81972 RepID=D7LEB9_ARALL|nr:hypothetical protein ARALYDRAFT_344958 [Arabidopsis lyrata subsp. lyrata]